MRWVAFVVLVLSACAPSKKEPAKPAEVAKMPLVAAGPRCQGGVCRCRPVDEYGRATTDDTHEGEIPDGQKRFEFRTGRGFDPTSVTIDARGTFEKDRSKAEPSCAYVDLPPGEHKVRARWEAKDAAQGIQPRLLVGEYGLATKDWYATFAFSCGSAQSCVKQDMEDWFNQARKVSRGIFDKCGATRVTDIRWGVEHSPGQTLEDLTLEFVLRVYKFAPRFPHGYSDCKGLQGGRASEEELMK
jgi:hypothetical protein